MPAFFSARSTSGIDLARASSCDRPTARARSDVVAGLQAAHVARPARRRFPSLRGTPARLPTSACDTDLASRCDCISDWPVAATCCASRGRPTQNDRIASDDQRRPGRRPSSASRMRCCSAAGRSPISGKAAPSGAAPVSRLQAGLGEVGALGRRDLRDDRRRRRAPSPCCGIASNAAAASTSASGRSVAACAAEPRRGL